MDHSIHLPSAGLNRFRFDGSACASQPLKAPRGVTKRKEVAPNAQGPAGIGDSHSDR